MRQFFITLFQSISGHRQQVAMHTTDSLFTRYKYLVGVHFLLMTIIVGVYAARYTIYRPLIESTARQVRQELPQQFPQALVIQLKDDRLSTNQPSPYHFDPPLLRGLSVTYKGQRPAHVITFMTDRDEVDYDASSSLIIFTRQGLMYPRGGEVEYVSYKSLSAEVGQKLSIRIDHKSFLQFARQIDPYLQNAVMYIDSVILGLSIAGLIFVPIFATGGWMYTLLFYAGAAYLVARAFHTRLKYIDIYLQGMYMITMSICVYMLNTYIIGLDLSPYTYLAIYLAYFAFSLPKKSTALDSKED